MMVTLYKVDKLGLMRFFTIHDLQRTLLGGYALTVARSVGDSSSKDKMMYFENAFEGSRWLNRTLATKKRSGFRVLYSYGFVRPYLEADGAEAIRSVG